MPIVIRKIRNKDLYSVKNKITGVIHAKGTTQAKAKAQKRLLDSLESPQAKKKTIKKKQIKTRKFNIYRRLSVLGGVICSGILASPMCCIIQQRQQKTKKNKTKKHKRGSLECWHYSLSSVMTSLVIQMTLYSQW